MTKNGETVDDFIYLFIYLFGLQNHCSHEIKRFLLLGRDFPGGSDGKEFVYNSGYPRVLDPWVRKMPLEKEMATNSSTIVWKIPLTEEPGRLHSMGSQRVGHNQATSLSLSLLV